MPRLLVVHHTPSPALHEMRLAIEEGGAAEGLEGVEVVSSPALSTTAADALAADAIVVCTPANLGSLAGATKHFFDLAYYPCLDQTRGRPFGVAVHGNDDVEGALRQLERITRGLAWRDVVAPVRVLGAPDAEAREACWNLGATVAATLLEG